MTKYKNEYTDMKNVRHTVKHLILSTSDQAYKEHIIEEIREVLSRQKKKPSEDSA